jgi:hypothetical protein
VPLAAEDFEDLIDSMGLAGTAAANLEDIMRRLSAATLAEEAALRVAAGTGQTVAQVKAALRDANAAAAAAAAEAAAAEKRLATEQRAAAKAAEEAAEAARKLAEVRAAQQQAADAAAMSENLRMMKVRDERAASEQKQIADLQKSNLARHDQDAAAAAGLREQGEAAEETSRWFANLSKSNGSAAMSAEDLKASVAEATSQYAAAVAIVTAYTVALYSLAAAAVTLTQEKDALRATFDVFTGGHGDALLEGIEDFASTLPFTADRLNALAKSMSTAVGTGDALRLALHAVASAEAIMGKSGAAAAEGLIKRFAMMAETGQKVKLDRRIMTQLAEAGVSVKALAAALGVAPEKLGQMSIAADELGTAMQKALVQNGSKALAVMGNTWGSISAKLKEGWDDAFEDLGDIVGPFMAQLRSLASEFFAGSIAGSGLKGVVRGVLTPAFEAATRVVRAMHIAVLEVQIAYLKAAIALRPVTEVLDKIGISGGIVNVIMYLVAGTAIVLAVIFGVLALAVTLVALPFILAAVAIYLVYVGITKLIALIGGAIANFDNLKNKVSETGSGIASSIANMVLRTAVALALLPLQAAQAGANFVLGLATAIANGVGTVAAAVKGLAQSALAALSGSGGFDSHSPSRKAHKIGTTVPGGLVQSFEEGEDDVDAAAEDVAGAGVGGLGKGLTRPRRGGKDTGGGGFNPTFNNCTFGSMTMQEWRDMMSQWWAETRAEGPEPETA